MPARFYDFAGWTLLPALDGATNVSYSFRIAASTLTNAEARRNAVLAGGIGTPVGSKFTVVFYHEATAEFGILGGSTGIRTRQALVNDQFVTYTIHVNGTGIVELGVTADVFDYPANNGWQVVEAFVPVDALDTGMLYDNEAQIHWTTAETLDQWTAYQRAHIAP